MKHLTASANSIAQTAANCKGTSLIVKKREESTMTTKPEQERVASEKAKRRKAQQRAMRPAEMGMGNPHPTLANPVKLLGKNKPPPRKKVSR